MKHKQNILFTAAAVLFLTLTVSGCASTKKIVTEEDGTPVYEYRTGGMKIEAEDMLLENTTADEDLQAHMGKSVQFSNENQKASVCIVFPEGHYECLLNMKAQVTECSTMTVVIGDSEYKMFTSNPPVGFYEYTLRSPVEFTVSQPGRMKITLLVTKNNEFPMNVDFIQFVEK